MRSSGWSLAGVVATWTAAAIGAAMAVYGVYQYLSDPGLSAREVVVEHLWHVVALGGVVYVVLWIGLRRILVDPIHRIGSHLYGVGTGRAQALQSDSRIREIQSLEASVNLMIQRMRQGYDQHAVDTAQEDLMALRELARSVRDSAPGESDRILAATTRLQSALLTLLRA